MGSSGDSGKMEDVGRQQPADVSMTVSPTRYFCVACGELFLNLLVHQGRRMFSRNGDNVEIDTDVVQAIKKNDAVENTFPRQEGGDLVATT
jgi:hypothetical protein